MYMLSDQKQSDKSELNMLWSKYEDVINEVSDLREYLDRITNVLNSSVGVIGVFMKGVNSDTLHKFSNYKSLGVVNGNLLDVCLKVVDFMWDICSFVKRLESEQEDNYLSENSGRVDQYRP